jgi:outer membrane protein assembly factor BamB
MKRRFCFMILFACGSIWIAPAPAATSSESAAAVLAASPEPGWPQWRGPRRDGICRETGLLQSWPAGGPKLLWKTQGLGRGYAAPILTGGRLFLGGDADNSLCLFALDMAGHPLWRATNGAAWKGPNPGSRASCAYRDGRLFQLNAHGRLACWDAASGKELWSVDIRARFGGKVNTWAYSECVLVDGARVIVTPGGTKALMAALDAKTGATVWTTPPLLLGPSANPAQQRVAEPPGEADLASYASPILFTLGGRRQLVNCSMRHVFGVEADTGALLWTRPLRTVYSVIAATPVLVNDAVFVTAPDTEEAALHRIRYGPAGLEIDNLWTTKLDTCHGGLVYVDGAIYGAWYRRNSRGFGCVDAQTGQVRYLTKDLAKGSILYADHRLYCLSEEGEMALLKPTPAGFEFTGKFRLVTQHSNDVWPHPVILDRKLYLRYHDTLWCYDVQDK